MANYVSVNEGERMNKFIDKMNKFGDFAVNATDKIDNARKNAEKKFDKGLICKQESNRLC